MSTALKLFFILTSLIVVARGEIVKSTFHQILACDDNDTSLDISSNNLERLGNLFLQSPIVTCINLERNRITEIADGAFQGLSKLHHLNLAGNKLPFDFLVTAQLSTVETLVLDEAFFIETPVRSHTTEDPLFYNDYDNRRGRGDLIVYDDYQMETERRTTASLRNNLWILSRLPHLRHLYLRRNHLTSVEIDSLNLPNITHLYLTENELSVVNFRVLPKRLTHLFLDNNNLSNFSTGATENLTVLHVDHNPLRRMCGGDDCSGVFVKDAVNLEELSLSHAHLETVDEEALENLRSLKYLDLSQNNILKIPRHALENLTSLVVLKLKGNQLRELPDFCAAKQLEELDLSDNRIQNISQKTFCDFPKLERLDLANNEIIEMTSGVFSMLESLKVLDLSGNGLTTLPELWFTPGNKLASLEVINLGGNPLMVVPMTSLQNLPTTMVLIMTPSTNHTSCH